jgi:hypothetical protein
MQLLANVHSHFSHSLHLGPWRDISGFSRFLSNESLKRTGLHLSHSAKSSLGHPVFQISCSWLSPQWQIIKMAAGLQLFKTGSWKVKLAARYQGEKELDGGRGVYSCSEPVPGRCSSLPTWSRWVDDSSPEAVDMNGRFQMQGGKNWILPK